MAGQVTDWAYKKVDWAYNAANWEWTANVATTAELFKYFSSTTIFRDSANVYDNKHYGLVSKYDGLMIRPVTGQQGYTGVCHFRLYNAEDRYYSDLEGLYGEFTLRDLVLMVFKACGLMVSVAKRTYWLNQVLSLMITLPAARSWVCNTSIRRAGGYNVAAYVDKSIVDDIIDCMRVQGMFEFRKDMIEEIVQGNTYSFEPDMTPRELLTSVLNQTYEGDALAALYSIGDATDKARIERMKTNITVSDIVSRFTDQLTSKGFDIDDDTLLCKAYTRVERTSSNIQVGYYLYVWKYTDDEYTARSSNEKYDKSDDDTANESFEGYTLTLGSNQYDTTEHCYTYVNYYVETNNQYVVSGNTSTSYTSEFGKIDMYVGTPLTLSGQALNYDVNFGYTKVGPEGVAIIEGAVAPKSTTSSSNFWPSWAARAVTVNAYSGSNHPSYTYIPVGYGDYDYSGFTQANVQSGWIYNNTWLQRLGLTMELMADYEPVEPDPDDPEPIRPDPEPEPEPTPPDPEPIDMSASRLFTVHSLSNAEVDALGNFIYSQTFIDAIKNMFLEPMDAIIGCFILNYGSGGTLPLGANETLKLGSVLGGTGVTGTKVTKQVFELSFGTKSIGHFYNNVLDYAPYTTAQIFLPYIGFCDIDINEIMGGTVQLKYRIDIFTGACLARLFVTKENNGRSTTQELYNFNGNVAVQVPLTGRDFTNSIGNFITGAASIAIGAATGSPVTAAIGAKGLIGNNATVKRSGTVSSNVGVLGNQTPFIVINRPKAYNALGYNNYYGYPSNWTVTLGSCSGYTRCKNLHLDALSCTDQEREEIETLLREGVIF